MEDNSVMQQNYQNFQDEFYHETGIHFVDCESSSKENESIDYEDCNLVKTINQYHEFLRRKKSSKKKTNDAYQESCCATLTPDITEARTEEYLDKGKCIKNEECGDFCIEILIKETQENENVDLNEYASEPESESSDIENLEKTTEFPNSSNHRFNVVISFEGIKQCRVHPSSILYYRKGELKCPDCVSHLCEKFLEDQIDLKNSEDSYMSHESVISIESPNDSDESVSSCRVFIPEHQRTPPREIPKNKTIVMVENMFSESKESYDSNGSDENFDESEYFYRLFTPEHHRTPPREVQMNKTIVTSDNLFSESEESYELLSLDNISDDLLFACRLFTPGLQKTFRAIQKNETVVTTENMFSESEDSYVSSESGSLDLVQIQSE